MTPAELLVKVGEVIQEQEEYTQALMFERLGIKNGEEVLAVGATVITFDLAFAAGVTDYEVWRHVYSAANPNEQTEVVISNKTTTGFTATVSEACTIRYLTTFPNLTIV